MFSKLIISNFMKKIPANIISMNGQKQIFIQSSIRIDYLINRNLHQNSACQQSIQSDSNNQHYEQQQHHQWDLMKNEKLFVADHDEQLQQVKIFTDEKIIQFTFKSGKSVNYTMHWLRNLCTCSDCVNNKFQTKLLSSSPSTTMKDMDENIKLSITQIRFSADSNQFEIDWLDDDYRKHSSIYNIKHLNLYYKH